MNMQIVGNKLILKIFSINLVHIDYLSKSNFRTFAIISLRFNLICQFKHRGIIKYV